MRYIKSIEIENFQSHKRSKIDFINGLNVISGPSDNGKTAIIRALKWVLYNEPKGADFIRQGENNCRVSIVLDDDTVIIREKNKSKNVYILINPDGKETRFEGFGNDIPEDIIKAHGIRKVYIDEKSIESINISEQLQGPFLLSESGPIKAKAIGKLVGVHYIDAALKMLDRDIIAFEGNKKKILENIDKINDELKEYEDLETEFKRLKYKEILLKSLNACNEKLKILISYKEAIEGINNEIRKIKYYLNYLEPIDELYLIFNNSSKQLENLQILQKLNEQYTKIYSEIKVQQSILTATKQSEKLMEIYQTTNLKFNRMNLLTGIFEKHMNLYNDSNRITKLLKQLANIEESIDYLDIVETNIGRLKLLTDKFNEFIQLNKLISIGNDYIRNFDMLEEIKTNFNELNEKKNMLDNVNDLSLKIKQLTLEIKKESQYKESLNNDINNYIDEYAKYLKELGKCPVCLSEINENSIEHVLNELKGDVSVG